MEFRLATRQDIPKLCALRMQQLKDEGAQPDVDIGDSLNAFFQSSLADKSLVQVLALENGEVAATGAVCFYKFPPSFSNPSGKVAYIANMFTAKAYRGRGLATQMLNRLKAEIARRGVTVVWLLASPMGYPFYLKNGFTPQGNWMSLHLKP